MKSRVKNSTKKREKKSILLRRKISLYSKRVLLSVKVLVLVSVIIFLFTNLFLTTKQKISRDFYILTGKMGFSLQKIIIQGNKNISGKEILSLLEIKYGTPILSINIRDIRKRLNQNSLVSDTLVVRRLPNILHIKISEKKPIAIWQFNQKLYLIDEEGSVINYKHISKFTNLLHVVGPDANVHAKQLIQELNSELADRVKVAIRYGERRWNLVLDQDITIKMPEKDFIDAWTYLTKLNSNDKLFNQNFKVIDLRDNHKYFFEKF